MIDKFQEFAEIIERGPTVLAEIESRLSELAASEVNFSRLRIRIGMLLKEVQDNKYWQESHESFGAYVESLEAKFHRSRTQCYAYLKLTNELLPLVGEDKLVEMSVSKAQLLSRCKKNTGSLPSPEVIEMASNSGVSTKAFRQVLLDAKKLPDIPQDGRHHSLEYFATADQQKTINDALLSVKRTENLSGTDEVQMGQALEAMSQEYLAANSGVL